MPQVQNHQPAAADREASATRDQRRKRYEAVIHMIERWQADPSDYEERIWPELVRRIEADRLSPRERFRE